MKLLQRFSPLWMLLLIPVSVILSSYSDGPPAGRTGAPGELTCFNGYCHNSFQLNSGPGSVSLSGAHSERFIPGQPYQLRLTVDDDTMQAFGFSVSARIQDSDVPAGSWQTDEFTQLKSEEGFGYIMHDTAQAAAGEGTWLLTWLPPDSLSGTVEFFVAAVAANNDGKRSGDYVYTLRKTIDASPLSAERQERPSKVQWSQTGDYLLIEVPEPNEVVEVEVMDMQGRLLASQVTRGAQIKVDVKPWPRQPYLVRMRQGNKRYTGKVLLRE